MAREPQLVPTQSDRDMRGGVLEYTSFRLRSGREACRIVLRAEEDLGFTTAEVAEVVERDDNGTCTVEIRSRSLGLFGASSPLPHYLAEELSRTGARGDAARALLDAVHNRLVKMYLQGVSANDLPRSSVAGETCWYNRIVAVLGTLAQSRAISPRCLTAMAPALIHGVGSKFSLEASLRGGLSDMLGGASLSVEELSGGWAELADEQMPRLGTSTTCLGLNYFSGRYVRHPAGGVNIRLAGLPSERIGLFSPGGRGYRFVGAVADAVAPPVVQLRLIVEVAPREHPKLGARRLGDDFWFPSGSGSEPPLEFSLKRSQDEGAADATP